jgi:hypothetical protein
MAAIARPNRKNGGRPMRRKLSAAAPSVVSGKVPAPVRVSLKRVNCNEAIPYPRDGQAREWWHRLKTAFGTASSAFVAASLQQFIAAARLPGSGISETAVVDNTWLFTSCGGCAHNLSHNLDAAPRVPLNDDLSSGQARCRFL